MFNTGRMLSGGQWCTCWTNRPYRASGKEREPMTPLYEPLTNHQALYLLDNRTLWTTRTVSTDGPLGRSLIKVQFRCWFSFHCRPVNIVDPTSMVNATPTAATTPGVWAHTIASHAVHPPPLRPLVDFPPPVCPLPVAQTLGRLFGGEFQGLDDHNPPAECVAQSWQIRHHEAIHVANCIR